MPASIVPATQPPQHFLYFLPLPQGHGSLRPTFGDALSGSARAAAARSFAKHPHQAALDGAPQRLQECVPMTIRRRHGFARLNGSIHGQIRQNLRR